jgi:hypothetical protein
MKLAGPEKPVEDETETKTTADVEDRSRVGVATVKGDVVEMEPKVRRASPWIDEGAAIRLQPRVVVGKVSGDDALNERVELGRDPLGAAPYIKLVSTESGQARRPLTQDL